jgi:uncharacterized Tic20 family protein
MLRFLALLIALVGPAYAEDVPAKSPPVASLNINVAYTLFAVIVICLLGALLIWRSSKSTTKGGTDSGLPISDKDLEAFRISYGFWLVIGALLVTLVVLVVTLTAFAPQTAQTTDIVAIIGAVTGVIGTLTAAFFGIQAAGAGRSQAMDTLDKHLQSQATATTTPSKLDPSYGPHAGSTRVSITGNGFTGANGMNFGVTPGTNFEFVNDGLVRASSPPAVDGVDEAKIMLVFPSASPPNREVGTFYYYTISPCQGGGGQSVTIRGSALNDVKAVKFGNKEVAVTVGPVGSPLKVMTPSREEAGNIDDVDVALIYPVDKATNFFVIGKYHYGPAVAGPPTPTTPTPTPQPVPPGPGAPLASGKGSWYSQYQGKYTWVDNGDAPNSNALGVPDADQGVSFLNPSTLGNWFEVHAPNNVVSIEQQTDIGPAASTGRSIDISAAAAERFGYSPQNFPTNATFQWRPISAPQAVINLSPKQQAIAYQKLRGTAAAAPGGPTTVTTPAWITLGRSFDGLTWTKNGGPMPAKIVEWMDNIATRFPEMAPYVATCKKAGTAGWWAWCGAFVQSMLAYSNIRGPISAAGLTGEMTTEDWAYDTAWENWGNKVWMPSDGSINDAQPQSGDVLVWSFGHVSFYDHHDDTTNTFFSLGGNCPGAC